MHFAAKEKPASETSFKGGAGRCWWSCQWVA